MNMFDDQQVTVFLKPKTAKGKEAAVEPGSVLWSGPSFVAITVAPGGLSATYVAIGVGSGRGSVSADADLGSGVKTISREFAVVVNAREADSLDIFESDPVDQVAAGPDVNPPPVVVPESPAAPVPVAPPAPAAPVVPAPVAPVSEPEPAPEVPAVE